jgi:hypothetical protein
MHSFLISALDGGERSASRPARFTPEERAVCTHWIGGWVDPRAGLDDMEKWKFLAVRGLELHPSVVHPIVSCCGLFDAGNAFLGHCMVSPSWNREVFVAVMKQMKGPSLFRLWRRRQRSGRAVVLGGDQFESSSIWGDRFVAPTSVTQHSSCRRTSQNNTSQPNRVICLGHGIDFCSVMGNHQRSRVQHGTRNEHVVLHSCAMWTVPEPTHLHRKVLTSVRLRTQCGTSVRNCFESSWRVQQRLRDTRAVLRTSGTATFNYWLSALTLKEAWRVDNLD